MTVNLWQLRLANRLLRIRLRRRYLHPSAEANLLALEELDASAPAAGLQYVVLDLETTGLDPAKDRVVSVGAFRMKEGSIRLGDAFHELANPGRDMEAASIKVHGITPDNLKNARPAWDVFKDFLEFAGDDILVAHFARFDKYFLDRVMQAQFGFRMQNLFLDTVLMCRAALIEPDAYGEKKGAKRCSLDALAARYGLDVPERHTALGDALAAAMIFQRLLPETARAGWPSLGDLIKIAGVR